MKEGTKGIGAFLLMILGFIFNIFVVVMPVDAILGHFCSSIVTRICIVLMVLAKLFIPLVPDLLLLVMYIIGIPFVWSDFPKVYFVIYIIFMIIQYIIVIPPIFANLRARRQMNKYDQMMQDFIKNPEDDVDIDEFDTNNDDDDYDYYR